MSGLLSRRRVKLRKRIRISVRPADVASLTARALHVRQCAVIVGRTMVMKPPRPRNKQPDVVRKAGPHTDKRTRTGRKAKHKGAKE